MIIPIKKLSSKNSLNDVNKVVNQAQSLTFVQDIDQLTKMRGILDNFYKHEASNFKKNYPSLLANVDTISAKLNETIAACKQLVKDGDGSIEAMQNWSTALHELFETSSSIYPVKHERDK